MSEFKLHPTRRGFMKGSTAAAGLGALTLSPFGPAFAAKFPSRNIKVYVPTREGGGADRNLRAFTSIWKNYLGVNFQPSFYPGAAGRVGYEKYMGIAKPDCYELLFGNMGPEVLNWVVKKPTFDLNDMFYFGQMDRDPGIIFVGRKSKFKHIDEIVAEGKKRTMNVGVSRLAHPATLGVLALGRHTGARFNVIPLSGGKNTRAGVATGEMDFGALPSGGIARRGKNFRILAIFDNVNPIPDKIKNAVLVNKHFGMDLPPLIAGARAFGIKRAAVDKYPDRFKILTDTMNKVYGDPAYWEVLKKTKVPMALFTKSSSQAEIEKYVKDITAIGEKYKDLLTGKT
ncbi:MAG: twin-arginine translocation signal domain-containing protein [Proteobacteria bacterium]|nr:twin-arginine translocation signal domain-containing protein [Pseudomonadota bacterium]